MPSRLPTSLKHLVAALAVASLFNALSTVAQPSVLDARRNDELGGRPVVHLDYGSYKGAAEGNVQKFYGMHYAAPPIRFAPPEPPLPFKGLRDASQFGAACPQQSILPGFPPGGNDTFENQSEDCQLSSFSIPPKPETYAVLTSGLFINVIKPAHIPKGKKLPVLFWIYGGGFMLGDTSSYNGVPLVERSLVLDQPVIYVSINHRLSAYGFLGGKEAKDAGLGNIGIRDQVAALEWVQRYIHKFGGDSGKVTIWGESAGAAAVGIHLVRNDGDTKGLFHAAFMQSGGPIPWNPIEAGQEPFDTLARDTGCFEASDKIACLRDLPYERFHAAVMKAPDLLGYAPFKLPFGPSTDGIVVTRNLFQSVALGLYAKVPIIMGNCDDEGTMFSFGSQNVTYGCLLSVNLGSPFGTGNANALTPQFKRIAAFQTDWLFHSTRRFFMSYASKTQPNWYYLWKRGKDTPYIGAAHTQEIPEIFGTGENPDYIGTDALISFANTFDPNTSHEVSLLKYYKWEQYGTNLSAPPGLTFVDPGNSIITTYDTYRVEGISYLANVTLELGGVVLD
ncbi:carotenoid ester lipase [Coprinopsis cinerea okayama7|uniref:Carboxylic ester hydrolase n=1 Tax=Coprinopsis cinerea (strain Okayama-7 / 130 / ATCC MYA-4618 / FGSC 9003) TaxID=240176 RepID=A8PAG1_COPC7|nr:carotenoid ester lipase [Coprinopsis cinerea okayama7\|eukprot:XP_001839981.2 carotenoid ester lipase [Coprinopsis cinerea okayama7\